MVVWELRSCALFGATWRQIGAKSAPRGATWRYFGAKWRQNLATAHWRQIGARLAPIWRYFGAKDRHVAPRGATWRFFGAKCWRYLAVPPRGGAHMSGKTLYTAKWRQFGANLAISHKSPNIHTHRRTIFHRQVAPNGAKWRQIGDNRHFGAKSAPFWRQISANLAPNQRQFGAKLAI